MIIDMIAWLLQRIIELAAVSVPVSSRRHSLVFAHEIATICSHLLLGVNYTNESVALNCEAIRSHLLVGHFFFFSWQSDSCPQLSWKIVVRNYFGPTNEYGFYALPDSDHEDGSFKTNH